MMTEIKIQSNHDDILKRATAKKIVSGPRTMMLIIVKGQFGLPDAELPKMKAECSSPNLTSSAKGIIVFKMKPRSGC